MGVYNCSGGLGEGRQEEESFSAEGITRRVERATVGEEEAINALLGPRREMFMGRGL